MSYPFTNVSTMDQEWSDILKEMNQQLKDFCLSETDQKFLSNITFLEDMKDIIRGCEAIETFKEISSQEGFAKDLFETIQKYLHDLWQKFITWLTSVSNWIHPYLDRCKEIKDKLGKELTMNPCPQIVTIPPLDEPGNLISRMLHFTVEFDADGKPCIFDSTHQPFREQDANIRAVPYIINSDNDLKKLIEVLIQVDERHKQIVDKMQSTFDRFMRDYKTKMQIGEAFGISTAEMNQIVNGFQKDIQAFMKMDKLIIESAKSLSKIKFQQKEN